MIQFFTMKLIEGVDLAKWLRTADRSPGETVEIVRKVAEAIHYAHQNGVLHRDVKPANILIDSANEPFVTDFGLAKQLGADVDLTMTGQIMGTPSYMAPEQATGSRPATTATDVYGLGAVLYACLTGKAPLVGDNMFETLTLVAEAEPEPPSRHRSGVDRDLDTICLKCLAKEPRQRYQSADELAQELTRWQRDEPIHARPVSLSERTVKWVRRNRSVAGLAMAMVLMLFSATGVIAWLASNYRDSLRERKVSRIVQEIREADVTSLELLQRELGDDWALAQPRLVKYFEKASDESPEKLNLALTLATLDPSHFTYVIQQLGRLTAAEFQGAVALMQSQVKQVAGGLIEAFQRAATPGNRDADQQSAAAAALIALKLDQVVWPSLGKSDDATIKNSLIDGIARRKLAPDLLMQRLEQEQDPAVRQSILNMLASLELAELAPGLRKKLTEQVTDLFATDPDAGVHASAWLVLRRWGSVVPEPVPEQVEEDRELQHLAARVEQLKQKVSSATLETPPDHENWIAAFGKNDSQPPTDHVVRYRFDNAENRYREEVSGTGGRSIGTGEAQWVDGVQGKAIHVGDANTIEGETSYYPEFDRPFSMGAWINREVNVDTDEYGTIFSRSVPGDAGFDLWIDDGALGMHLVSISTGGWMVKVAGTNKLPTDRWIHVLATYDGSRKATGIQLYVNGRRIDKQVFEAEISGSIASAAPFCIGQRYDGGRGTSSDRFPFHGAIDEICMFDRRLSDYEVGQVYEETLLRICQLDTASRTTVQRNLLREHHQETLVAQLRSELASALAELQTRTEQKRRRWFVSRGGPMFSVLSRPGRNQRLPYTLAVSICPITVAEYQQFDGSLAYDSSISRSETAPVNSVSRHDAAGYCNWLSERDGIAVDQWCYEQVDYEVIQDPNNLGAGKSHKVFYAEKVNSLELSGYRLPTLDEWHFACRAGTTTPYSFGHEVSLFANYAWSKENSAGHAHAVGSLLPNDFGIFDMHGGLWEWTSQGARHDCRLVGGSFHEPAQRLKFDISHSRDQFSRVSDKTFRVVRTLK